MGEGDEQDALAAAQLEELKTQNLPKEVGARSSMGMDDIQALFPNLLPLGCSSLPWVLLVSVGKQAHAFLGKLHKLPSKTRFLCCDHPRLGGKGALVTLEITIIK